MSGNFVRSFGTDGVPETFVINRQGRIVALRRYQLAGNWLQQTVARVLDESRVSRTPAASLLARLIAALARADRGSRSPRSPASRSRRPRSRARR